MRKSRTELLSWHLSPALIYDIIFTDHHRIHFLILRFLQLFTAGIGENDDYVRQEVCKYLGYLGVDFDFEVNTGLRGKEAELTKEGSKVKVFVIPTNEELAIARETLALVK